MQFTRLAQRLDAVTGDARDLEIDMPAQRSDECLANEREVVRYQHTYHPTAFVKGEA